MKFADPPEDVRRAATRVRLAINSAADVITVQDWLAQHFAGIPVDPFAAAEWVMCCHAHHHSKSRYRSTSRKDLERAPI